MFALGLTLIMGIFDICNFAYGEFVMVAGFISYLVIVKWGLPYLLAPVAAMVVLSFLGIILRREYFIRCVTGAAWNLLLLLLGQVAHSKH